MTLFNFSKWGRKSKSADRLRKYGFSPAVLNAFDDFIARARDRELYQANPRYWAGQLGLGERETLSVIVAATVEGLLDLNWQVACPICKYHGRVATSLGGVGQFHGCENCDHDFEAYLDEGIFVTVTVKDDLRRLSPGRRDDATFRALVDARHGLVTALAMINTPAFNDLLGHQILPEGQSLGVRRLAVFFSDLRGSTAFYLKLGDTEAYRRVCEHFKILFEAAARHDGAAVKTMGDGVMGVFANPRDAVRALVDSVAGLAALNQRAGFADEDRLALKIGLHVGPCILVTLNGRLDYFGETVNIAARLSALAEGDDVIMSHTLLDDPDACALVEDAGQLLPLTAKLRGLPDEFELHRLVIA
ncbi:MAG: adenylate/guanylate cyclase domain-containing protein [Chloroflexi bacterium]|nr:adenylate/guanylate cyclase domain-containing protein [Chloroflexota bacterium]